MMPFSAPSHAVSLPWCDPLEFAASYSATESMVFLHNGLPEDAPGNGFSILALGLDAEVTEDWDALAQQLSTNQPCWDNAWFGWIGYEMKDRLEPFPSLPTPPLPFPALWFGRFRTLYLFHHPSRHLYRIGSDTPASPTIPDTAATDAPAETAALASNMTRAEYLAAVRDTIAEIHAGRFYQANITRKFYGRLRHAPADPFALFRSLCQLSPAAYSAYLRIGGKTILSSSPECFLTVTAEGHVTARPIKGTAPRRESAAEDAASRNALAESEKDKAENLMIVDLMRNDLSHHCLPGSVEVDQLFHIHSYRTLHHMASTIHGRKMPESTTLSLIKGCFPPGSMTGAPKISAMRWCGEEEAMQRGIYSGAIGWLGGDGSADLSVVIRTLLLEGNRFEFQVGGGIVADSDPEQERQETLTKAKALLPLLAISPEMAEAVW